MEYISGSYAFQKQDYRTARLPSEASTLYVEPGPNQIDENSAVLVAYQVGYPSCMNIDFLIPVLIPALPHCHLKQVGPGNLRENALLQLLVHLGKRDAFNELRTQQQV